jgi:hypothetical protein
MSTEERLLQDSAAAFPNAGVPMKSMIQIVIVGESMLIGTTTLNRGHAASAIAGC